MKLSLLIPTIVGREHYYDALIESLAEQVTDGVEIIRLKDNREMTIGEKRNKLLQSAKGDYVAFIDDDDRIGQNYIKHLLEGINKGVDVCSLTGIITTNGLKPKKFIHYLGCPHYMEWEDVYHRYPNHLNCIRADIAKRFTFPEKNHGEDTSFADQLKKSRLLKTEHTIDEVIYYYDYKTKK